MTILSCKRCIYAVFCFFLVSVEHVHGLQKPTSQSAVGLAARRERHDTPSSSFTLQAPIDLPHNNKVSVSVANKPEGPSLLQASVLVGVLTALMGFVYGQVLSFSVHSVWSTLPNWILSKLLGDDATRFRPVLFMISSCTLGGLLMGVLSNVFSSAFTVADFVSKASSSPVQPLPHLQENLIPLLLLSLVTSTFGFSVGPEAPMVCAGALVGAAVARNVFDEEAHSQQQQTSLAYAGAAGALTAFMGIPLAGSIFALEMTRADASLAPFVSSAATSSIAAWVVLRGFLWPNKAVGGHFAYGVVGSVSGRAAVVTALLCGAGGALLGHVFCRSVAVLKHLSWSFSFRDDANNDTPSNNSKKRNMFNRNLLVKCVIGLLVGGLSSYFPQTLFWGEGSLQTVVDGQQTPFIAIKHGLQDFLTSAALVNTNQPFATATAAAQVGVAKLLAIALACAGKFPGGIIFPIMFAAAPLAHALTMALPIRSNLTPLVVMCLMASTQASVTRTPLATALILSLSASSTTELSSMLPAMLVSSYLGVFVSLAISSNSYFSYNNDSDNE